MLPPEDTEAQTAARSLRPSALRRSALERLAFVALPTACLWLAVAFALDLWR